MPKNSGFKKRVRSIKDRIYQSEWYNKLEFSDSHRAFTMKPSSPGGKIKKLAGLLPKLEEVFWPNYEYIRNKLSSGTGVRTPQEGIERGKIVHNQVKDYFNMSDEEYISKYKSHGDKKTRGREEIHAYTDKFVRALDEWKMAPVISELPVVNISSNIGTAVDALCVSKSTGALFMLEIKNGFDHYMLKGNHQMEPPLERFSNAPLNQAHLQLAFTKYMFEETYGIRIDKAYIVNITQDGVVTYPLDKKIEEKTEICISHLTDYLKLKKIEKAKKTKTYKPIPKSRKK